MKKKALKLTLQIILLIAALYFLGGKAYGQTIYVDAAANGIENGSSWNDAYTTLQDALSAASSGDQVWVVAGTYYPDEGDEQTENDRGATFQLANGVAIYGGFAGTETEVGQRDWQANVTTLDGDIDGDGDVAGNAYHVVRGTGTDATAVLDGFTITGGNALTSSLPNSRGGGMLIGNGSPTLGNLVISGNSAGNGGGMYVGSGSPVLTNVTFSDNEAFFLGSDIGSGGGLYNNTGSPTLINVSFSGNQAQWSGGGMYNGDNINADHFTLTNVTFSGNSAAEDGGGMYIGNVANGDGSVDMTLVNVTFTGNRAGSDGGGIYNSQAIPVLSNVILWNNSANGSSSSVSASIYHLFVSTTVGAVISHSLIANSGGSGGGWDPDIGIDGGNNIDVAPQFLEPVNPDDAPTTAGNLRLADGSPAVDMGDPNTDLDLFPTDENGNPLDLAGNPRVFDSAGGGIIDMGPYEVQDASGGQAPFITTWQTDAANESITIPVSTVVGGYNYNVDWGDGATDTGLTGDATHTYAAAGTYTVSITGDFPAIQLGSPASDDANDQKLVSIDQWGDIAWSTMLRAFQGATNLQGNATDTPDLSGVTDMSFMFQDASAFNQDLSEWDVSGATNMFEMFGGATAFNGEIGDWEVGSVIDMGRMFIIATSFNQDIGGWDVSGVENTTSMFHGAASFNQDIGGWDVSGVTSMTSMFEGATSFNGDIGGWEVNGVTTMARMFDGAEAFNQDIGGWNFTASGGILDLTRMFVGASAFDQDLGGWNVAIPISMDQMLDNSGLSTENYDNTLIGWAGQGVESDVPLGAQNLSYCASQDERQSLIDDHLWSITGDTFIEDCLQAPFVTTWQVEAGDLEITIPTEGGGYNYAVDWGDGDSDTGVTGDITHTYGASGTYTVEITGDFPRIFFAGGGDAEKLLSVEQWGDIAWSSMEQAFEGATNLQVNADDAPDLSGVTSLSAMFAGAASLNSDLNDWDVSNVVGMSATFHGASAFNGEIGGWDVSGAETMEGMFKDASAFNQDIGGWSVSSVTDMGEMFSGADAFNQDIGEWDVSGVTNMAAMFFNASAFNQDIGDWEVANVIVTGGMFYGASAFNQDISGWDVSSVFEMAYMFHGASSFNRDIGGWDVSNAETMGLMFLDASAFDQDLSGWDISGVTDMSGMLNGTGLSTANYDATLTGWAGQDVQDDVPLGAEGLTYCASRDERQLLIDDHGWTITGDSFVEDCLQAPFITIWQTNNPGDSEDNQISIPTDPADTYDYAIDWGDGTSDTGVTGNITHTYDTPGSYTVEITGDFPHIYFAGLGDAEKILSIEQWGDIQWSSMERAFQGASNLQVNADDAPDLSGVTSLGGMFIGAASMNSNLNDWDVSNVRSMSFMFQNASVFNGEVGDWEVSGVETMIGMFAGASAFNQDISGWDVSSVIGLDLMFNGASAFNQDIGDWEVSNVENMVGMFAGASAFNQDIGGWDVSNVSDMEGMLFAATAFNQDIGGWDVTSVEDMSGMLNGSGLSTENYDNTLTGWAGQAVLNDVPLGAEGLEYCAAASERQSLIDDDGWEISGDSFVDECLQTDLDLTLTVGEGWRMLSNPIVDETYAGMLEPLWTQGVPGSDYEGDSNTFQSVYTWDLDSPDTCLEGDPCPEWLPTDLTQTEPIPPGSGFLVYVFEDDDFDGTVDPEEEAFDKTLTLSGIRHSGEIQPEINENGNGWTLVGNPYDQPVAFNLLERIQVNNAAYVYDANADPDAVPDDGPTNGNGGAWRSTVDGLYGDITDGVIAPGQGFFVQTEDIPNPNPSLTFSESDQTSGGEFYGKESEPALSSLNKEGPRDYVRLEVQGESLYNSAWIRFSSEGSAERTDGEALELQPLSANYAMLAARKADGTLMDIAHYPLDTQELEIPLAVEATQSGQFTIRSTDLDLPAGMSLHLYDRQTGQSMPLGEDFEYRFELNVEEATEKSPLERGKALNNSEADCAERGVCPSVPRPIQPSDGSPMKAVATSTDRFLITTTPGVPASELPGEIALGQNYPNPFNPSTVISYQLPAVSQVRLDVYDMLGRRVATLVDEQVAAGTHRVSFNAGDLSSGVYLYRLQAGSAIFTKKLTLIK